jgi:5-methylcytosine-specific restriction endonuclease McrA
VNDDRRGNTVNTRDPAPEPQIALGYQPVIVLLLSDYVGDERCFRVSLGDLSGGTRMHPSFAQVMSADLIDRIRVHGRCAGCGRTVDPALMQCRCGHVPGEGGIIEVMIFDKVAEPSFDQLVARLLDRAKSRERRARLAAVPCTLTQGEVAKLLEWQRDMCFYCGESLYSFEGNATFHRDHRRSLRSGGATTIENTVLACAECNRRKGTNDQTIFRREVARQRRPEVRVAHTAMLRNFRRRLAAYLAAHYACPGTPR